MVLFLFWLLPIVIGGPCDQSKFECHEGGCIQKHEWCNGISNCQDGSDEQYCKANWLGLDCGVSWLYRCKRTERCIPRNGICDGFVSCPDLSDEEDCACEEIPNKIGYVRYTINAIYDSIIKKCWKISLEPREYVQLNVSAKLVNVNCAYGNVTIAVGDENGDFKNSDDSIVICPGSTGKAVDRSLKLQFFQDVIIWYRSTYRVNSVDDYVGIEHAKIDKKCLEEDKFRCDKYSCIPSDKECDRNEDCSNGLDEKNCDYGVLSAEYSEAYRRRTREWMQKQRDVHWSWKENTAEAIVALHLTNDINTNNSGQEEELIGKQLEIEVATYLLRSTTDKVSVTELSAQINALLVICHDPRAFYGFDLIALLREELVNLPGSVPPYAYLTLCNAKENVTPDDVERLFEIINISSDQGFVLEIQSLAIMALACITKDSQYKHLKGNITEILTNLKSEQLEDGSFGNDYTTALIAQALIANNVANQKDDSLKSAIEYIRKRQEENGSFGDFLTTYLVLPVLNFKSLVDIRHTNCSERRSRRSRDSFVTDIKDKLGGKTAIKYSLIIGDEKDQIHPVIIRVPDNITIHELMSLAADIDPKYEFKIHHIRKKMYIYEISKVPNDPLNNKFWFLYENAGNMTLLIPEQSPNGVTVGQRDHIIAWYKTFDFI